MLHEYNWFVLFAALIIPGGFIALGTYHLVKLVLQYRIRKQTEPQRLVSQCSTTLFLVEDLDGSIINQPKGNT
jgi:hypothetical protein